MKKTFAFLYLVTILLFSCGERKENPPSNNTVLTDQSDNLKTGGLYLLKREDSTYYVAKILVLDEFAVHLRTYGDTFKTPPSDINSDNLKPFIGHAPLDRKGFLIDHPVLLKVEKVKESELEGYNLYLQEMSK